MVDGIMAEAHVSGRDHKLRQEASDSGVRLTLLEQLALSGTNEGPMRTISVLSEGSTPMAQSPLKGSTVSHLATLGTKLLIHEPMRDKPRPNHSRECGHFPNKLPRGDAD
jgi:hypothetical protein